MPFGVYFVTHTHTDTCISATHTHTPCEFQGENTVQLQDPLRGSLPGLQRAVSSVVTQQTQAWLMQKYKDMLAVDISREQA